jgi:hypothetical protein
MQMTDLHWHVGYGHMWDALRQVIKTAKPDLIMLTGDIVTDTCTREGWEKVIAIVEESGIPWAVTFGNHDREFEMTKPEIVEFLKTRRGNLTENGPDDIPGNSNFILKIGSSTRPETTASVIYCFDTRQQHEGLDSTQVAWYRQNSEALTRDNDSKPFPALAYLHIPLTEYRFIADSSTTRGEFNEPVCDPPHNTGALSAFVEKGDVMGVFVGHDHTNNFIGIYDGICLAYGYTTIFSTSRYGTGRGVRMVELTEGKRTFTTWLVRICEEPYNRQPVSLEPLYEIRDRVTYPDSFMTTQASDGE